MTLPLYPYQKEGAKFLARKARGCLFDEMGIGKTAQIIGALDMVLAERVLVICPAAVREVWAGELKKFQRLPRKVLKAKDIQDLNLWLRGKVDVLLVSFELATNWEKHLMQTQCEVVVIDEGHALKNDQAKRTRAILGSDCTGRTQAGNRSGVASIGTQVWFATGTPAPNDAADIWSLLRYCGATTLSRQIFRNRYYEARAGMHSTSHTPRREMVPELKQAIRSCSLRRTKADIGMQLPPLWMTDVTVDGDTREVLDLLRQYPDMEAAILEAVENGNIAFIDAQHIATLRRLVAEAKAPSYTEMLKGELENGAGKRVVFGLHVAALSRIRDGLVRGGVHCTGITGSTSERERVTAVDAFQNDPDCRVFIGNIKAAGTGLTLTAGADIDMFESSWSPADNAQAIMRCHRIGQKRHVNARFIILADSIDVQVSNVVERKTRNIAMTGTFAAPGAVA